MKMLIARIGRWFHRFCNRFSIYELCQPQEKVSGEKITDIQLPYKEIVGNEVVVSVSASISLSETTDMINKRRKHNGLDRLIARLRRDVKRKRREVYGGKGYDYNHRR